MTVWTPGASIARRARWTLDTGNPSDEWPSTNGCENWPRQMALPLAGVPGGGYILMLYGARMPCARPVPNWRRTTFHTSPVTRRSVKDTKKRSA